MLKLIKGEDVKILSPESSLIQKLLENGWVKEGDQKKDGELEALRAEAEALGLKVHPRTGIEKLKADIAQAKEAE